MLQNYVWVAALCHSFFMLAFLAFQQNKLSKETCFLMLFLFGNATSLFSNYLDGCLECEPIPELQVLAIPLACVIGPALFLFCVTITQCNQSALKFYPLRLLIPTMAALLLSLPVLLLGRTGLIQLMNKSEVEVLSYEFFAVVCLFLLILFYIGVTSYYLIKSCALLKLHVGRMSQIFSNLENKTFNWLRKLLLVLLVVWLLSAIDTLFSLLFDAALFPPLANSLFELFWLYLFSLMLLLNLKHWQVSAFVAESALELSPKSADYEAMPDNPKYAKSALSEVEAERIALKLQRMVQNERLYEQNSLSILDVSQYSGVSSHKISQVLNGHLNTTFYDFINRFRIEAACQLLGQSDNNLLTISEQVGFNARSTFNSAFKKVTGTTPSHYRKQQKSYGTSEQFRLGSAVAKK